jgi:hypothetical protein
LALTLDQRPERIAHWKARADQRSERIAALHDTLLGLRLAYERDHLPPVIAPEGTAPRDVGIPY